MSESYALISAVSDDLCHDDDCFARESPRPEKSLQPDDEPLEPVSLYESDKGSIHTESKWQQLKKIIQSALVFGQRRLTLTI